MNIRIDEKKCSGCGVCKLACSIHNFKQVTSSRGLLKIEGMFPEPGSYKIHFCDQCGLCAESCPEEAIYMTHEIYKIDGDLCTGCHLCVESCPHSVIIIKPEDDKPAKCILCGECAAVCPRNALITAEEKQIKEYS